MHLDGLNAEKQFQVWVTILDNTSHYYYLLLLFSFIRSLKYHLVVMLGARIDVIQPQIRNLITYLLPLPDKQPTTAVACLRCVLSGMNVDLLWLNTHDCVLCVQC